MSDNDNDAMWCTHDADGYDDVVELEHNHSKTTYDGDAR